MEDTGFFHIAILKGVSRDVNDNGVPYEPPRTAQATRFLVSGLPPLIIPAEKDEWLRVKLCFAKVVWSYFLRLANNSFEKIQCIVDDLVKTKALKMEFNPLKGAVVLARHPNDQQIYRAVVIRKNKVKSVEVYFVDFGYICDVDTEEVFSVPPETGLCDFPPQAFCVMMNNVPQTAWKQEDFEKLCEKRLTSIKMVSVSECSTTFSVEMVVVGDDKEPYNVSEILQKLFPTSTARGTQQESERGAISSANMGSHSPRETRYSFSENALTQSTSMKFVSHLPAEDDKFQQSWNNKRQAGTGLETASLRAERTSQEPSRSVSNSALFGSDEKAESSRKISSSGHEDAATGARSAAYSRDILSRGLHSGMTMRADMGMYSARHRQASASREQFDGNRTGEWDYQERRMDRRVNLNSTSSYATNNTLQESYGRSGSRYGSKSSIPDSDHTVQFGSYRQKKNDPWQGNRSDPDANTSKAKWSSKGFDGSSNRAPSSFGFHSPSTSGSLGRFNRSHEYRTASFSGDLDQKKRNQLQVDAQRRSFCFAVSKISERRNEYWPTSRLQPTEPELVPTESGQQKSEGDHVGPESVLEVLASQVSCPEAAKTREEIAEESSVCSVVPCLDALKTSEEIAEPLTSEEIEEVIIPNEARLETLRTPEEIEEVVIPNEPHLETLETPEEIEEVIIPDEAHLETLKAFEEFGEPLMQERKEGETASGRISEKKQAEDDMRDVSERLGNMDLKEPNGVVEEESTTALCNNWDDEVPEILQRREPAMGNVSNLSKGNVVVHENTSNQSIKVTDVVVSERTAIALRLEELMKGDGAKESQIDAVQDEVNSGSVIESSCELAEETLPKCDDSEKETVDDAEPEILHQKKESEVLEAVSNAAPRMNIEINGVGEDAVKCAANGESMATASVNNFDVTHEAPPESRDLMKDVLERLQHTQFLSPDILNSMLRGFLQQFDVVRKHERQLQQESANAVRNGGAGDADEVYGEKKCY